MTQSSFPPEDSAEGIELLRELAFNLRSAWNHLTDALWEQIDPEIWRETGNPWLVIQSATSSRLRELWATPGFRDSVQGLHDARRAWLSRETWFASRHATSGLGTVAFFSMEYAVSESLPIYSGGLGNVAGDYMKAASDLGVPMVGVGLLYQQGYFRQALDARGTQQEYFPFNDVNQLPVAPVYGADGVRVRVKLPRPGPPVWLRAWEARVGRVRLYLLDSNDPANTPADRAITAQLYGGGPETRLLQEMALGIGGWRLLRALGIAPQVCHLNEGHATFAALERAREFMHAGRHPFSVAVAATRAGNVFTTHTPVEAGFDRFSPALVDAYLGTYVREGIGIPLESVLALGRATPDDRNEPLNMAWLAVRLSGAVNAVSLRHEQVSRRLFAVLFPRWPESNVPVGHVTNGIHVPSWDSAEADALWTQACGADRWQGTMEGVADKISATPDATLWAARARARESLVPYVRERLTRQLAAAGMTGRSLEAASQVLNPDALTIGMARRFTDYKRPTLLLHDSERFARLLRNPRFPVQIVVAGKAHPRDEPGKRLVEQWTRFVRRDDTRPSAVFLADYDLRLAEHLVQGVDVWINTPRPPWEACGTSGMKVLVNGGINLSSSDGWWAEAYRSDVGWALEGDGQNDDVDAARLYELLENEVVPSFYDRDSQGIPRAWVRRMRASMAGLTPTYSANRAICEYVERYYISAGQSFERRAADAARGASRIVDWTQKTINHWPRLRFGDLRTRTDGGKHHFEVQVYADDLDLDSVGVELFADGKDGSGPVQLAMQRGAPLVGARGFVCVAEVPDVRPVTDFTPRAIPLNREIEVPLEAPLITWAR